MTPQPSGVTVTAPAAGGLLVSWNMAFATLYTIYRGTELTSVTHKVASNANAPYFDATAEPGTAYFYGIEAKSRAGTSAKALSVSGQWTRCQGGCNDAPGKHAANGVAGAPGKDGPPGKDGADGVAGAPGKDGPPGKDGAPGGGLMLPVNAPEVVVMPLSGVVEAQASRAGCFTVEESAPSDKFTVFTTAATSNSLVFLAVEGGLTPPATTLKPGSLDFTLVKPLHVGKKISWMLL